MLCLQQEKSERERRASDRERQSSRVVIVVDYFVGHFQGVDKSLLEKQTLGLLRREMLVDTLNLTIVIVVNESYVESKYR